MSMNKQFTARATFKTKGLGRLSTACAILRGRVAAGYVR